jgi:hypothetical protein
MVENTTETVSQTVRAACEVISDGLKTEPFADAVDAVLEPVYPEVVVAYTRAHFTAEIP